MAENWYPVIDRATCIECGACVEQCSHGVFDKSSPNKPEIIYPDGCIDHCHGCGALCPTGSITYAGEDTGWTPPNSQASSDCCCDSDCSCGCDTAAAVSAVKDLNIDFLYLDLNTCERCMATDETLKEAIEVLSGVFDILGYQVKLNSVNISSEGLAEEYRFLSSPTIRVNGADICAEVQESDCADCGALCGDSVDCRVFVYEGVGYEQPPVAMIVDGILKAIYGQKPEEKPYVMPENLKKFFAGLNSNCGCDSGCCDSTQPYNNFGSEQGMKTMSIYEPAMCCPTGICGVGVDPELLRISTVLDTLKKNSVTVNRYNLTSFPQEFVKNEKVNERMMDEGVEVLPITVVDGKIVITKRYPGNDEFIKLLGLPAGILPGSKPAKAAQSSSCCCSGGDCC